MNNGNQQLQRPSHDDSKAIKFGLGVVFLIFGVIGFWAAFAPLASFSVATGSVSAGSDKKTIQHLEGGKVTAIYVKDGDKVKKDQILLKLRDVQIKAQLDILNSQYQDAIALFARLKAQRDDKISIIFPKDLSDKNAIKDQENIFFTAKKAIEDEQTIAQNKIAQYESQISGLNSIITSKEKRLDSIIEEQLEWEELFKQRLVDKQKIRELKREKLTIKGDLANIKFQITKLDEQISEVKTQKHLMEKESRKETLQRYVEAKSLISDLKSKIIANDDTLQRTNIVSPIDGTVVGLNLHTVGGIINQGDTILEIVPHDSELIVIAQVQTTDIDKVKIGLFADVMFSAFNLTHVHVIQGEVIHVSADSFVDKASGLPYYEAKIKVTKEGKQTLKDNGFILISGMPAQVMIQIGDRTALSYFVKPFSQMIDRSFNEE